MARPGETFLFLLLFGTYAYFYQSTQDNEAARLDQTRALLEKGTLAIDAYWLNSADVIHYEHAGVKHVYPAKAPGMSLLGVPPFGLAMIAVRLLQVLGLPEWIGWHLVTYATVVTVVSLLSAIAALGVYRLLRQATGDSYFSGLAVIGVWLGTISFPFSTVYFGHQVTAALLALSFCILFGLRSLSGVSARDASWRLSLAGFLAGFAVVNEYPAAIIVLLLCFYVLWLARRWEITGNKKRRLLCAWALGGACAGAILVAYNLAAFGKPFYLAYEALNRPDSFFKTHQHGYLGLQWPGWSAFFERMELLLLKPPIGLLYITVERWRVYACNPVLWLALPGFYFMLRDRRWRAEGVLVAAIFGASILFIGSYGTSMYDWGGGSYLGSRLIIPALPFLALPLFFGARRFWFAFYPLLAVSVFYMLLATAIEPRMPMPFENPERDFLLPDYLRGRFAQNARALFDPDQRKLTADSTALNLGHLAGLPGRWQLGPLMLWWVLAGGAFLFVSAAENRRATRPASSDGETRRLCCAPGAVLAGLGCFATAVALAPVVRHAAVPPPMGGKGLLGRYFRGENWSGSPVEVHVDRRLEFDWARSFPLQPPFSVEWSGMLNVEEAGLYTFYMVCDDGAALEIAGQIVLDLLRGPVFQEKSASIALTAGLHPIRVRYFNALFGGAIKLWWTPPQRAREIVPADALMPETPAPTDAAGR